MTLIWQHCVRRQPARALASLSEEVCMMAIMGKLKEKEAAALLADKLDVIVR